MAQRTRGRARAAARAAMAVCAAAALAGCVWEEGNRGESPPGPAGTEVTVVRGDDTYPLTVRVTGWEVAPHPQVPERGNAVHFTYDITKTDDLVEVRIELAACAVDSADVVLLCGPINVYNIDSPGVEKGDSSLGPNSAPDPDLSGTARVLLLPDQLLDDGRAHDPKDHDGYKPPGLPTPGDRLRTG
ncbi:hypothetical protein [Streptomyces inusitatus]|uniref:hypothetical protein n=1 Tax=Streptomyces inusitatus TaxID=68221 RepID=UPI00167E6ADD|nr:hypothetical protein [Streptomyces inusitatus]